MDVTTIRIKISTKEQLDKLKIYKKETYDDLLKRLLITMKGGVKMKTQCLKQWKT